MKIKAIKKILDEWGFQKHIRHYLTPSKDNIDKELTVVEEWNNEEMARLIFDEVIKE